MTDLDNFLNLSWSRLIEKNERKIFYFKKILKIKLFTYEHVANIKMTNLLFPLFVDRKKNERKIFYFKNLKRKLFKYLRARGRYKNDKFTFSTFGRLKKK